MLRRLYLRALVLRRKAQRREKRYGWLFPVLAPPLLVAAAASTYMIPLVSHWGAVAEIEGSGGVLHYHRPAAMSVLSDNLLVRVQRVELSGGSFNDASLETVSRLRGVSELVLSRTSITPEAISDFRRRHPDVSIY